MENNNDNYDTLDPEQDRDEYEGTPIAIFVFAFLVPLLLLVFIGWLVWCCLP